MKYFKLAKQKFVDFNIVGIIAGIMSWFCKKRKIMKKVNTILIYKLSAIGDSILALPMIQELKNKTHARIVLVCAEENKDVFFGQEFIDKTIVMDNKIKPFQIFKKFREIKKESADYAIDTSQSTTFSAILSRMTSKFCVGFKNLKAKNRNKLYDYLAKINPVEHMVSNYFELVKPLKIDIPKKLTLPSLKYSNIEYEKIKKLLPNSKNIVGFHTSSNLPYKEWSQKKFVEIIEYVIKKNYFAVLLGTNSEREKVKNIFNKITPEYKKRVIDLAGRTNIKELFVLMKFLKLFVGNDGGVMHIAVAENIPTLGLFGIETPKRYGPFNKNSIGLYKGNHKNPMIKSYAYQWPNGNYPESLEFISVKEVKKVINNLLKIKN